MKRYEDMTSEEIQQAKNNLINILRTENGGKETRYEVMNREIKWNTASTTIVVCVVLVIASLFLLKHML